MQYGIINENQYFANVIKLIHCLLLNCYPPETIIQQHLRGFCRINIYVDRAQGSEDKNNKFAKL